MSKATKIFERLLDEAFVSYVAFSDDRRLEKALRMGEPIPDRCKPGYLLMNFPH